MCKTHLSIKCDVFVAVGVLGIKQSFQVIPCQSVHPVMICVLLAKSVCLDCTNYIKATNGLQGQLLIGVIRYGLQPHPLQMELEAKRSVSLCSSATAKYQ